MKPEDLEQLRILRDEAKKRFDVAGARFRALDNAVVELEAEHARDHRQPGLFSGGA